MTTASAMRKSRKKRSPVTTIDVHLTQKRVLFLESRVSPALRYAFSFLGSCRDSHILGIFFSRVYFRNFSSAPRFRHFRQTLEDEIYNENRIRIIYDTVSSFYWIYYFEEFELRIFFTIYFYKALRARAVPLWNAEGSVDNFVANVLI